MLSKNDMKAFRGMVTEVVTEVIDAKVPKMIATAIEKNNKILKREIRDEMHSVVNAAISASEKRVIARMDEGFDAVMELIDDGIIPQIDAHDRAIAKLNLAVGIA